METSSWEVLSVLSENLAGRNQNTIWPLPVHDMPWTSNIQKIQQDFPCLSTGLRLNQRTEAIPQTNKKSKMNNQSATCTLFGVEIEPLSIVWLSAALVRAPQPCSPGGNRNVLIIPKPRLKAQICCCFESDLWRSTTITGGWAGELLICWQPEASNELHLCRKSY